MSAQVNEPPRWPADAVAALLLRCVGMLLCCAAFAVLIPTEWMVAIHRILGLGEMPRGPLVEYLTRSLSALYAAHGGCMLVASSDVRRMRPMVIYLATIGIVIGAIMLAIDLWAGMPWYWTLAEGPPTALMSGVTLYFARRIDDMQERRP